VKSTYLISYDKAENIDYNYGVLYEAIKSYGVWAHITESFWAVSTYQTAEAIRNNLSRYLPEGSRLFVIRSGFEAAWLNVICSSDWLQKNL
jgi:hypothetical protein